MLRRTPLIICTSQLAVIRRMCCITKTIIKTDHTDTNSIHSLSKSRRTLATICHPINRPAITIIHAMDTATRSERGRTAKAVTRNKHRPPSAAGRTTTDTTITGRASRRILIRHSRQCSRNHKPPKHQIHEPRPHFNQTPTVSISIRRRAIPKDRQATSPFRREKAPTHKTVSKSKFCKLTSC